MISLSALHAEAPSHAMAMDTNPVKPLVTTPYEAPRGSPPPSAGDPPKPTYTWSWLVHYEIWVLLIVNTFAWGCSTARYLLPLFRDNVGRKHLELGVGTGYYLVNGNIPASTRLTLVDKDPRALNTAVERMKRQDVTTFVADILDPLPVDDKFDSISMYYIIDSLRASVQEKCNLLGRLRHHLAADGVLHGATILGKGVRDDNSFARFIRNGCTKKGIFRNQDDNAFDFEKVLRDNFKMVETRVVGTVFLFRAVGPILSG